MEMDPARSKFNNTVRKLTEAHAEARERNITDGVKIFMFPGNSPVVAAAIL